MSLYHEIMSEILEKKASHENIYDLIETRQALVKVAMDVLYAVDDLDDFTCDMMLIKEGFAPLNFIKGGANLIRHGAEIWGGVAKNLGSKYAPGITNGITNRISAVGSVIEKQAPGIKDRLSNLKSSIGTAIKNPASVAPEAMAPGTQLSFNF